MSNCKLDHTREDVKQKFESQADVLPKEIIPYFERFLSLDHSQQVLNEMFHLLKKYDLSSEEEREQRNKQMMLLAWKLIS